MHRLRTVTYLDVSAVAGHHAMSAALLLHSCCQEFRKIEEIPIPELDSLFARFLLGARKVKTHEEYEPSTLRGFISSLDRYLRQHGCNYTLVKKIIISTE